MASQSPGPNAAGIVTGAILAGAAIIAILGTVLPGIIGLAGTPAIVMQVAFYAVAVVDVVIALWLRARLRKARSSRSGATVQRQ